MSEKALRRIPLEKLVDLKVDYAFKKLFGQRFTLQNLKKVLVIINLDQQLLLIFAILVV